MITTVRFLPTFIHNATPPPLAAVTPVSQRPGMPTTPQGPSLPSMGCSGTSRLWSIQPLNPVWQWPLHPLPLWLLARPVGPDRECVRPWRQAAKYDPAATTPVPAAVKTSVRRDRQLADHIRGTRPPADREPGPRRAMAAASSGCLRGIHRDASTRCGPLGSGTPRWVTGNSQPRNRRRAVRHSGGQKQADPCHRPASAAPAADRRAGHPQVIADPSDPRSWVCPPAHDDRGDGVRPGPVCDQLR